MSTNHKKALCQTLHATADNAESVIKTKHMTSSPPPRGVVRRTGTSFDHVLHWHCFCTRSVGFSLIRHPHRQDAQITAVTSVMRNQDNALWITKSVSSLFSCTRKRKRWALVSWFLAHYLRGHLLSFSEWSFLKRHSRTKDRVSTEPWLINYEGFFFLPQKWTLGSGKIEFWKTCDGHGPVGLRQMSPDSGVFCPCHSCNIHGGASCGESLITISVSNTRHSVLETRFRSL